MLRIAICDDTPLYTGELAAQLHELAEELTLSVTIDTYQSYATLGEAHAAQAFDVIFLEVALRDGDGIEFARQLRGEDLTTDLVYYSSSATRALEAYATFPTGYLLKPPQKRHLKPVLEFIATRRGQKKTILFRTPQGGRAAVALDDIRYVEVMGNDLSVHTERENIECLGSLSETFRAVSPKQFYRCHRSFLVNMRYVRSLHRYHFLMKNGDEVAVAKNRYAQAKEILNDFLIFERKNE